MKDIIRFTKKGRKKLVMSGVTIEQAREWCSSKFTKSKYGHWFDGFAESGTYCHKLTPIYSHYFIPTEQV